MVAAPERSLPLRRGQTTGDRNVKEDHRPIAVMSIAGSDSGGGAGIQADIKTFAALGVHGCSAITAITAQNSVTVDSIHPLPVAVVLEQIRALLSDFPIAAVKTGMLPTPGIVAAVAEELSRHREIPLVVDPVLRATAGEDLLSSGTIEAMKEKLFPLAALITPNRGEASLLSGSRAGEEAADIERMASSLLDTGCRWVLITGGDHPGDRAIDLLFGRDETFEFPAPKVDTIHTHGSGCAFASAITARIALGDDIPAAVRNGKCFITQVIENPIRAGKGRGPIHPLHRLAPWEPPS